jgi:hypothetical protein
LLLFGYLNTRVPSRLASSDLLMGKISWPAKFLRYTPKKNYTPSAYGSKKKFKLRAQAKSVFSTKKRAIIFLAPPFGLNLRSFAMPAAKGTRAKKSPASVPSNVTSIDAPVGPHLESSASGADANMQEHIRARAYEFFEMRGREHGHDMEDWLRAEAEVRQQSHKRTA